MHGAEGELKMTENAFMRGKALRRQAIAAFAMTVCTFAFIAGAAAQSKEEWDKVIAAAKREGKVVAYSAYVSPKTHEPINKAFEQKYGIPVEMLMARGSEMRERIRTEQAAGRHIADVYHTAVAQIETGTRDEQFMQPSGELPDAAKLKPEFRARATPLYTPIFTINYGFLYNTRLVKPEDAPKSWADLLDPKWKGKILSDDPRASGGGRVMFHMTVDKFGKEFQEKLALNELTFSRDYQEAARRVTRGEYAIYIPFILGEFNTFEGLPAKYVLPAEGVTYGSYAAPVLKDAPHPNAARLLSNFYLSDEAQTIYAKTGHGIVVEKLNETLSPELDALANVKPLVAEDFTRINEMFALAKQIYK
jgi:iron(III) transport system substrate-binding protein